MQQSFTKQFMYENCGCYNPEQLNACSFMQVEGQVTLKSIIESEIPLKDKYWFVCQKIATKEENQQIAITVAEMVLPIFEEKYPSDKRPREAIEAAKMYIAGHISIETLLNKRYAAAYSAAAKATVDSAKAAGDAITAYAAAYSAADADVYFAAAAAYAAAYSAADAYSAVDVAAAATYSTAAAVYSATYAANILINQQLFDYLVKITS